MPLPLLLLTVVAADDDDEALKAGRDDRGSTSFLVVVKAMAVEHKTIISTNRMDRKDFMVQTVLLYYSTIQQTTIELLTDTKKDVSSIHNRIQ